MKTELIDVDVVLSLQIAISLETETQSDVGRSKSHTGVLKVVTVPDTQSDILWMIGIKHFFLS